MKLTEEELKIRQRIAKRKYKKSDKGKLAEKRYKRSAAGKASSKKYGKSANNKYNQKKYYIRKFGIEFEDYERMVHDQNNLCAICKNPENVLTNNKKLRSLAIDHCHMTGKIRGLLCCTCNRGLGLFKDNPEFLLAAASYVAINGK